MANKKNTKSSIPAFVRILAMALAILVASTTLAFLVQFIINIFTK